MTKRISASILCAVILLALIPAASVPAFAAGEKELYNFPFDDEAAQGEYVTVGECATIEWVSGAGVGHGDDKALKTTHIQDTGYKSSDSAVRLTLSEPLPAGGTYRIVAWVYAASAENPGKGTLTGPGFVINEDYPGAQGEVKFPVDFGTLPMDEWKGIDVTLPMQEKPINTLDFRIVINEADKHPDVWYWDNIEIYQVGDLEIVETPEWDSELASLREAYQDYFLLGNILEPNQISDPATAEMYKRYYSVMTAGNAMKPVSLSIEKDTYSYSGADQLVDWALANDIQVHGHTLVWHEQSPQWVNMDADGNPLTRAEAKENLGKFIGEVAGHFKGKVISWDVVNEAFDSSVSESISNWREGLRVDVPWYRAYANGTDASKGEDPSDYIYDAFVYARQADPGATLFYLDFNEEYPGKREAMAQMTEEFNERWKSDPLNTEPERLLVEGLGLQAHYWSDMLDPATVEATIQRFAQTGARLTISELDIPLGTFGNFDKRTEEPTEEELQHQADLYRQLFEIFTRNADLIDRVTIWGLADTLSWRGAGLPVLFDKFYNPKPAFNAVMEAVGALQTEAPEPTEPGEATLEPADSATPAPTTAPTEEPAKSDGLSGWLIFGIAAGAVVVVVVIVLVVRKKR